jgi:glucose-6-phosphate 1-dehydrogenase
LGSVIAIPALSQARISCFQRADAVEAGWRIVQPFLDAWRNAGAEGLASYQAGTPGPAEAERLIMQNGRAWRSLTEGC